MTAAEIQALILAYEKQPEADLYLIMQTANAAFTRKHHSSARYCNLVLRFEEDQPSGIYPIHFIPPLSAAF